MASDFDVNVCATMPLWPDTAKVLGVSRATIYKLAQNGELPVIRAGRKFLVLKAGIKKMLGES